MQDARPHEYRVADIRGQGPLPPGPATSRAHQPADSTRATGTFATSTRGGARDARQALGLGSSTAPAPRTASSPRRTRYSPQAEADQTIEALAAVRDAWQPRLTEPTMKPIDMVVGPPVRDPGAHRATSACDDQRAEQQTTEARARGLPAADSTLAQLVVNDLRFELCCSA